MPKATHEDETLSCNSAQAVTDTVTYIQQALLLVLENITASINVDPIPKDMIQNFDFPLVLSFARDSNDLGVRNHIFSLITTIVKIMPDLVFGQMVDILAAIGEYATEQWDNNAHKIFEGLISAILPCWLSRNDDTDQLFQIFVKMLANVSEHRRVFISVHILRGRSGGQFLGHTTLLAKKQWEYEFAVQLCSNYSCSIWLPSVTVLLKKIGSCILCEDIFKQMFAAMLFIADKLQDPEISRKLKSKDDLNDIQVMIGELMEQVVCHQQLVESAKKRLGIPSIIKSEMKAFIRGVLRTLMNGLPISTYLEVIVKLIGNDNENVRNKALQLFCETMKDLGTDKKFEKKNSLSRLKTSWSRLDENCLGLVEKLCLETLTLFESPDDVSSNSTKLAASSVLEVVAERFPSQDRVFSTCLGSVCKRISSDNVATSSHCLLTAAALVNALGLSALPELPNVMKCVLKKSSDIDSVPPESKTRAKNDNTFSNSGELVFASILQTLVAITEKLAGFLNPYLGDILKLVVLHPLALSSEPKLKAKADALRECITERIPARLLLPPLLSTYAEAVSSGDCSVSTVFVMLRKLVSSLDRPSVAAYHAKVFDFCLLALGLRTQSCDSIQNIDAVEQNIIGAFVTLTMKLTESMFRPLFIKTVEWSTSESAQVEANSRAVSFFNLINKLAEDHRSLFVPYFKYLIDGCVKGLVAEEMESGVSQKKRKKVDKKSSASRGGELSPLVWRLRASIMEALRKCFLYDTASPRFLDSSKFQVLLQPLVSQLVVEPPDCVENYPSVKDVDDLVVSCIGQMAVAADSDLLWKPLNHEVLMQTRSEKVRARVLGVRVVKFLVDNLRDGYMALLPETIPFLGELLEDGEVTVKTLAQQVIVEMETITGESLKDYL
ncbi:hypothetical protein M569_01520 [Genlisea aurea]|uniref:BP28 C-terminal domain-containing protein n=1 Tax=Genlisea aurea TaxID=192259 RepID=S8D0C3_9LAMI|nr:hypothetical protein M569_01520 [Genlisea aurea]